MTKRTNFDPRIKDADHFNVSVAEAVKKYRAELEFLYKHNPVFRQHYDKLRKTRQDLKDLVLLVDSAGTAENTEQVEPPTKKQKRQYKERQ